MNEELLKAARDYLEKTKDDWNYILPEDLEKQRKKKNFFILDIRRPEDFRQGHIPGAHNIFWLDMLKPENLKKLPKNKTIVLYCYVGHTSSQAMTLLKLLGYDVVSLKFGMGKSPAKGVPIAGWLDYGLPTTKSVQKSAMFMIYEQSKKMNIASLDKAADALESLGMLKEASDVDSISNSLEEIDKVASWLEKYFGKQRTDSVLEQPLRNIQEKVNVLIDALKNGQRFDVSAATKLVNSMRRSLEAIVQNIASLGAPKQESTRATSPPTPTTGTGYEFVE